MRISKSRHPVFAADDFNDNFGYDPDEDAISDQVDDLSDQVDDLQDQVDDIDEDPIGIEIDNNISNHYIAECESCKGIFISAVIQSDQQITTISGTCPLCQKETDQYLKWVIKDVDEDRLEDQ